MPNVNPIFNQLLQFLPRNEFNKLVGQLEADKYKKSFTCWQQFTTMLYAIGSKKESLRDIETGLSTHQNKWHHLGLKNIARSTIAHANNTNPHELYEKMFYATLKHCQKFTEKHDLKIENPLYSMDATMISLALDIFPWAHYQRSKGGIKLHTLLNNKTTIPELIVITDAKVPDMVAAREATLGIPKYSIIAMDKGYMDLKWFHELDEKDYFFVTRLKKKMRFEVIKNNKTIDPQIISDQIIKFSGRWAKKNYPQKLRLVKYRNKETGKIYEYITNNLDLSARTIADIYKARWEIETFFRWIKQNLKIKTFFGTSKNAVLSQIWIAMIYYLLLAFIAHKTNTKMGMLAFTRSIREVFMDRIPLIYVLGISHKKIINLKNNPEHLALVFF